ncbi:hypothetical protein ACQEVS_00200 [Streptomyces sp. CA-181903]|uniref:hypothetical protein n=1 Tax=Streptomyces sp. CA-181903 TaxID=3240055 RepID=UPI003D9495A4
METPHAVSGPGGPAGPARAALEVGPLPGRPGIRARGEISVITRPSWEAALTELARRHGDVSYVELSGAEFLDVGGVTALAVTALRLPAGRIVVEHPPPHVPRVLEMFWPGLRRIEVVPR